MSSKRLIFTLKNKISKKKKKKAKKEKKKSYSRQMQALGDLQGGEGRARKDPDGGWGEDSGAPLAARGGGKR